MIRPIVCAFFLTSLAAQPGLAAPPCDRSSNVETACPPQLATIKSVYDDCERARARRLARHTGVARRNRRCPPPRQQSAATVRPKAGVRVPAETHKETFPRAWGLPNSRRSFIPPVHR